MVQIWGAIAIVDPDRLASLSVRAPAFVFNAYHLRKNLDAWLEPFTHIVKLETTGYIFNRHDSW